MKKLISVLLAVLMMFSLVTVAFAEDSATDLEATAPTEEGSIIPDLGDYDWILDLPFWTVGPALKLAKIAVKLIAVYLKVAKIFGLVDKDLTDYIMTAIYGMIEDAQQSEAEADTAETTTAPAIS